MSTAWWWRGLLFESVRSHRVVELVSKNLDFFITITIVTTKGWGQFSCSRCVCVAECPTST